MAFAPGMAKALPDGGVGGLPLGGQDTRQVDSDPPDGEEAFAPEECTICVALVNASDDEFEGFCMPTESNSRVDIGRERIRWGEGASRCIRCPRLHHRNRQLARRRDATPDLVG